ncbi:unnamed protein product [Diplocarpon coronariae]
MRVWQASMPPSKPRCQTADATTTTTTTTTATEPASRHHSVDARKRADINRTSARARVEAPLDLLHASTISRNHACAGTEPSSRSKSVGGCGWPWAGSFEPPVAELDGGASGSCQTPEGRWQMADARRQMPDARCQTPGAGRGMAWDS